MDVRCEKCQTEYELDESKLKPGGVTVKCTSCGHMFKVRRRITAVGPAVIGQPASRATRPPTLSEKLPAKPSGTLSETVVTATSEMMAAAMVAEGDKTSTLQMPELTRPWLIRLSDGEILTCQELLTLQKWIAAGRVDRSAEISRTGKKWKMLGGIGELSSFFEIADEAREVSRTPIRRASTAHPNLIPRASSAPVARSSMTSKGAHTDAFSSDSQPTVELVPDDPTLPIAAKINVPQPADSSEPTVLLSSSTRPAHSDPAFMASPSPKPTPKNKNKGNKSTAILGATPVNLPPRSVPRSRPGSLSESGTAGPMERRSSGTDPRGQSSGPWGARLPSASTGAESGPTRGTPRASSQADVHFGSSLSDQIGERKGEFENGAFVPTHGRPTSRPISDASFNEVIAPPSSAGRWIAIISIIIILGGLAFLFLVVLRGDSKPANSVSETTTDAAVPVITKVSDARTSDVAPANPNEIEQVLSDARQQLYGDSEEGLQHSLELLTHLPAVNQRELPVLVAKAQIGAALAQHHLDRSMLAKRPSQRNRLRAKAVKLATQVEIDAIAALEIDNENIAATVARADSLRLRGRPARRVEGFLNRAFKINPTYRDARLSRVLLLIREDNERRALKELESMETVKDDVRVPYRMALLKAKSKKWSEAKSYINSVLANQPEHAGAKALAERLAIEATGGDTDNIDGGDADDINTNEDLGGIDISNTPSSNTDSGNDVDSYDRYLDKADKAAEGGNCSAAKGLYSKALDIKPAGVAALTGLGYCYLDSGQYSSAHTKFRAALGISSRYQDAMWGMAELYERQGNKTKAISQFKKFITAHPNSRRAKTALKKIERLGGATSSSDSGNETTGGNETTTGGGTSGSTEENTGTHEGSPVVPPSDPMSGGEEEPSPAEAPASDGSAPTNSATSPSTTPTPGE